MEDPVVLDLFFMERLFLYGTAYGYTKLGRQFFETLLL